METLMQESHTRQELLENTINHFNSKNRSIEYNTCLYRAGTKGCAIGRELPTKLAILIDQKHSNFSGVTNNKVFELLPQRLQSMGQDFLERIQDLHDDPAYWNDNGLSEMGEGYVKDLRKMFELENSLLVTE